MNARSAHTLEFRHTIEIAADPSDVQAAFFDREALADWWQAASSIATPRALGAYAIEWDPTSFRDDVLGRLGGVFHGTVMEVSGDRSFLIADAWWLPPDGEPVGPMALHVTSMRAGGRTRLTVVQSGFDEGPRWRRYYEWISQGWITSLEALRLRLERRDDP